MILITRIEKQNFLTGWRAWLAGAAMSMVVWCALAAVAFVMIGFAAAIAAVPVLLLLGLLIVSHANSRTCRRHP